MKAYLRMYIFHFPIIALLFIANLVYEWMIYIMFIIPCLIYHMRNKTKHTLRDRWLMCNILDMICDSIDIRRVYKRRDRMIWKSIYDLLLSDGNFNRYALRHYNSVLNVCTLFRIERFIFWRHVAILYGTRLFSYRYPVSQIHVKTFYIFP